MRDLARGGPAGGIELGRPDRGTGRTQVPNWIYRVLREVLSLASDNDAGSEGDGAEIRSIIGPRLTRASARSRDR